MIMRRARFPQYTLCVMKSDIAINFIVCLLSLCARISYQLIYQPARRYSMACDKRCCKQMEQRKSIKQYKYTKISPKYIGSNAVVYQPRPPLLRHIKLILDIKKRVSISCNSEEMNAEYVYTPITFHFIVILFYSQLLPSFI